MTLLTEIIDGASGESVGVPTLLRKLKILGARTDTARLGEWVGHELDGYPDVSELPSYRGPFPTPVLGHFMGTFGSEMRNIPIPPSTLPEEIREGPLFAVRIPNSVAQIEEIASKPDAQFAWPADAVRYYNAGLASGRIDRVLSEDMLLAQAFRSMPRQIFVGVLDAVRTRGLDLALELERVAPQADEPGASPEDSGHARQTLNTYNFFGSTSNVAIGG